MALMTAHAEMPSDVPYGYKYMPCRHCGEPMLVGAARRKPPVHPECGVQAASDAMRDMASKSGPYYERWKESMAKRFSE